MESWELKGHTLEFAEGSHTYLLDGIIVPSVTQALARKFPGEYSRIDPEVLAAAAARGTAIHKSIENYCNGDDDGSPEVWDYKRLEKRHKIKAIHNEIPVIIDERLAGRVDMVAEIDGAKAVADIKTTSTLNKEKLALQLNLYKIGVEQNYDIKIEKLYGIHLRDGKAKLVEVPILEGEEWKEELLIIAEA